MARPFAYAILAGALLAAPLAAPVAALAQPATDPAAAPAGTWALDKRHASLTLRVKHFGTSNYTFRLSGLDGSYAYDPANPTASKVSITVDPKSVDTGLPNFNKEISDDPKFFDSAKYPTITFVSTKIEQTSPGKGKLTGDLTFRGVTKPVTLDVTYNGFAKTPFGSQIMGFSAAGKIKRSEFGFTHLVPMVSDDVDLAIEAEFNPKK
ncbi:polyisoprenoid-binding protein [Caulobacter radicis]|uniref:YceI family protein n=1 Tax=Caulobacter radicis TaxID=2172650 RepID=UPI000D57CED8|nr:YceI family protein [Caulobacter radicis]PVM93218.1 polyisoprenoid-binding protein [Caulobacter radicis]